MATAGEGIYASTIDSGTLSPDGDQRLTLQPKTSFGASWEDSYIRPSSEDFSAALEAASIQLGLSTHSERDHTWLQGLNRDEDELVKPAAKRRRLKAESCHTPSFLHGVGDLEQTSAIIPAFGNHSIDLFSQDTPSDNGPIPRTPSRTTVSATPHDSAYGPSISGTLDSTSNGACPTERFLVGIDQEVIIGTDSPLITTIDAEVSNNRVRKIDPSYAPHEAGVSLHSHVPTPSTSQQGPSQTTSYLDWNPDIPIPSVEKTKKPTRTKNRARSGKKIEMPAWMRDLYLPECIACGNVCDSCSSKRRRRKRQDFLHEHGSLALRQGLRITTSSNHLIDGLLVQRTTQERPQTHQSDQITRTTTKSSGQPVMATIKASYPIVALLLNNSLPDQQQYLLQQLGEAIGYFKKSATPEIKLPDSLRKHLDTMYDRYQVDVAYKRSVEKYLLEKLQLDMMIDDNFEISSYYKDVHVSPNLRSNLDAIYGMIKVDEAFKKVVVMYLIEKMQLGQDAVSTQGSQAIHSTPSVVATGLFDVPSNATQDQSGIETDLQAEFDQLRSVDDAKSYIRKLERLHATLVGHLVESNPSIEHDNIWQTQYTRVCARVEKFFDENDELKKALSLANNPEHRAITDAIYQARHRYAQYINNPENAAHQVAGAFWSCSCGSVNDSIFTRSKRSEHFEVRKSCRSCNTSQRSKPLKYINEHEAYNLGGLGTPRADLRPYSVTPSRSTSTHRTRGSAPPRSARGTGQSVSLAAAQTSPCPARSASTIHESIVVSDEEEEAVVVEEDDGLESLFGESMTPASAAAAGEQAAMVEEEEAGCDSLFGEDMTPASAAPAEEEAVVVEQEQKDGIDSLSGEDMTPAPLTEAEESAAMEAAFAAYYEEEDRLRKLAHKGL